MPDPSTLRDSTQIVLPRERLEGLDADLTDHCTVTIVGDQQCRIIGSPVEIKKANRFLARHGVTLR